MNQNIEKIADPVANQSAGAPSGAKILQIEPGDIWDEFVSRQNGFLFLKSVWARTLELSYQRYKGKILCYVLEDDHQIRCGTIGIVLDFYFIKIYFNTVPYGGILGEKKFYPQFLSELERHLKAQGIHQLRFTSHFLNRFELDAGYRVKEARQFVVNLEGLNQETLWDSYNSSVRRAVKKAVRNHLTVRSISSEKDVDDYYELYKQTMSRKGTVGAFPKEHFYAIYHEMVSQQLADFLIVEHQGKPIASTILLFSSNCVIDYLMVSNEDYFVFRPNDFLTYHAINRTLEMKKQYFDFATGPILGGSLEQFKSKWGAESYPFYVYDKIFSPIRAYWWETAWNMANTKLGAGVLNKIRKLRNTCQRA